MNAPPYFLPRPELDLTPAKQKAFDDLWHSITEGMFIGYQLPYPKWQFLSYLCETRDVVLHGSQLCDIELVEPRQAMDKRAFSSQCAIYATTDGIWVIYFAILDRRKYPEMSLFNSCFRARIADDTLSEPLYFFSITHSVLSKKPWCNGAIYILPRQNFTQETPQIILGTEITFPHWISTSTARPIAKIMVYPQDFPFLKQIHGHDDEKLVELIASKPGVFPIEAVEI